MIENPYVLYTELVGKVERGEELSLTKKELDDLKELLLSQDDLYRKGKLTLLSDTEYDFLHSVYTELTGEMIHSSTREQSNEKIEHDYPMLKGTMEKVHYVDIHDKENDPNSIATHKTMMNWIISNLTKLGSKDISHRIGLFPKYDGVSIQLTVNKKGDIVKAVTRGDSELGLGEDRTALFENINILDFFPKALGKPTENWGLKIECIMTKDNFKKYNEKYGDGKLINERSAITSLTNSTKFTSAHLKFITIEPLLVYYKGHFHSYDDADGDYGPFKTYVTNTEGLYELMTFIKNGVDEYIDSLDVCCDGVVIRFLDQETIDTLGRNEQKGVNNFEVAYKFPKPSNYTTLLDIEQDIGLMGKVSFTAKVQPFEYNNKTIKSVSLGSYDRFKELKLAKGDMVNVKYEIIPYLLIDAHTEKHRSGNPPIPAITHCPYCNEPLEFNPELSCVNLNCQSRVIGKIYNFCEKMNMKNIGESTIETLYHHRLLTSIEDLFTLHLKRDEVTSIEGFGDISFTNLIQSIHDAHGTISDIVGSIGIPSIGRKIFAKILSIYHIDELLQLTEENYTKLTSIPGIKEATARKVFDGIKLNRNLITFLLNTITIDTPKKQSDEVIVFTGFRNTLFKEFLESLGYEVADSISSKTTLVIAENPNSSSGKLKKARDKGIAIIDVFTAYDMFGYSDNKK